VPGDGVEKGRRGAVDYTMVEGQTEEQHRPLGKLALVTSGVSILQINKPMVHTGLIVMIRHFLQAGVVSL
jgi:hypothetical protein